MTTRDATALCQALDLPAGNAGAAPDWIHILPAGVVVTVDGRGPYTVADAGDLARASLQAASGKLALDETHSTDLAAPKGLPAPARGWIVELQSRADGIWGRVEWTDEGKKLVADRAYRSVSPVIRHDKANRVSAILRASLVNTPNLRGLAALHQETSMDLLAKLRSALGLKDDADEAAVMAAIGALKDKGGDRAMQTALQAVIAPIAKAVGLKDDADAEALLQAVTALGAKDGDTVKALQTELAGVTTKLNALQGQIATEKATGFVDNAIKAGRVGVKPLRDHYIAMHAADPARVEKEINAFPILGPSGAQVTPPAGKDGKLALNAEQLQAATLLGLDPEKYRETLQAEQAAHAA